MGANPDKFKAVSLAAGSNIDLLANQVLRFNPEMASVKTKDDADRLKSLVGSSKTRIAWGEQGIVEAACLESADMVLSAVVGSAGLVPTWRAIEGERTSP